MRFGIYSPTSNEYDVATLIDLALSAEAAGWDGFFIWDNLMATFDGTNVVADTTVALTAIALNTRVLRFGALVTPLARRRSWKFAKETATLDRLSGGRLVVGIGLGGTWDFLPFGEELDERARAELLDEGIEVVTALWSGTEVTHAGGRFELRGARLRPPPVQQPRVPVWTAGYWPGTAPFRRAARWDGVAPLRRGHDFRGLDPTELKECIEYVMRHRTSPSPLDVAHFQTTPERSPHVVRAYEDAGATWWLESSHPVEERLPDFRDRIMAGPPSSTA